MKTNFNAIFKCTVIITMLFLCVAKSKEIISANDLYDLKGIAMSHAKIQRLFAIASLQKISTFKKETFSIKTNNSFENHSNFEEATTYISLVPPIELVSKKVSRNIEESGEALIEKIKIGYPLDGNNFIITQARLTAEENDIEKINKNFLNELEKGNGYFPFEITTAMTPDEILKKFKRAYFSESIKMDKDRSGYIDFTADKPDNPFPLIVWFYRGHVCGVDIK